MLKQFSLVLMMLASIFNSEAAVVWHWSNPSPHGNNITDIGYHGASGLTIQVADSGQIYTSSDLINWLPQNSFTTNVLEALDFLQNRIVITGANGTVVFSDDGVNYVYTNLATADWLVSVAASSTLVVAVGDNAAIYTSSNGASWKRQSAPPGVGANWLLSVAYGGGLFIATGENGYIASSPNGSNWTQRASGLTTYNLNQVAWLTSACATNGFPTNAFVAVADGGRAFTSTNGTNWSAILGLGLATNSFYAAIGNDTSRVLAGDGTVRLGSQTNGSVLWREQTGPTLVAAPDWTYYCGLWTGSAYALGGDAGMWVNGVQSTNGGYIWSPLKSCSRDCLFEVIDMGGLYVAVGDNARIMTSSDGMDWAIEQVPNTNSVVSTNTAFFGVGGTTNLLIAVGTQGSVAWSTNGSMASVTTNADGSLSTNQVSTLGMTWNPIVAPTTNDLHGVAVWNGKYFLTGGTGTILSSATTTNWARATTPTTAYLSGIDTYSGGLVCVGDTGVILTSPDGVTWTKRASGTTNWIFRVHNFAGKLIAVGENGTILTSTNGSAWSAQVSGTTAWLNDVQLVTNAYYITASDGIVLTSTNATNWSGAVSITENSLYGAAVMNGQLIAVGDQGAILRSQIIPDLTPPSILSYSRTGTQNVFLVGGQTDQSFTLDSSTNLTSWTQGPLINISDDSGSVLFLLDGGTNTAPLQFYRATLTQ